ncbi:hypothetical protein SETIT_1G149900v2 [Setaria italica]|uniref:Uncharacterized protein n=2 Tax=Setaria TaxID=4554 RepID=A0A368PKU0_SETIT|nr:hypothetical protein SETIT_1G149900v2 [Setaria italica]TKW39002.1 hypothetical protein SEVIR_1G149300v2 [Setaria viridis]
MSLFSASHSTPGKVVLPGIVLFLFSLTPYFPDFIVLILMQSRDASMVQPIEELLVSRRNLQQLNVCAGEQDRIVIAYVMKERFETFVTTSIRVTQEIGHYHLKIITDDDYDHILYIKLLDPADVARFYGHSWS